MNYNNFSLDKYKKNPTLDNLIFLTFNDINKEKGRGKLEKEGLYFILIVLI